MEFGRFEHGTLDEIARTFRIFGLEAVKIFFSMFFQLFSAEMSRFQLFSVINVVKKVFQLDQLTKSENIANLFLI